MEPFLTQFWLNESYKEENLRTGTWDICWHFDKLSVWPKWGLFVHYGPFFISQCSYIMYTAHMGNITDCLSAFYGTKFEVTLPRTCFELSTKYSLSICMWFKETSLIWLYCLNFWDKICYLVDLTEHWKPLIAQNLFLWVWCGKDVCVFLIHFYLDFRCFTDHADSCFSCTPHVSCISDCSQGPSLTVRWNQLVFGFS